MAKVDLHLHSKYSDHPSEWFLQRLGAAESYSEPQALYRLARERGMDLVTITDHNRIDASLELAQLDPERCFSGVESTAYFPEDGCKVHILIYGLDRDQFIAIQQLRRNIYQLRDYLRDADLACVVAHPSYAVNRRLTRSHLEKLILLFNNFEGRNGSRSSLHNDGLSEILRNLTPAALADLQQRHGIEPWGKTAWRKGLSGGSDDHSGLFVGKTWSETQTATPAEFLECLKRGEVEAQGRQNDFLGLTFAIYKIAYDFSQHKSTPFARSTLSDLTRYLFSAQKLSLGDRLRLSRMKSHKNNATYARIVELIETSRNLDRHDIDRRLELLYDGIGDISDRYFRELLESLTTDLGEMDILRLVQGISSAIPGLFLAAPFFSAMRHIYGDRQLLGDLKRELGQDTQPRPRRILWVTDTLADLNGVSMTLQTIGRLAIEKGHDIRLLACLDEEDAVELPPAAVLRIPPLHSFALPHYPQQQIKVPSLLRTLKQVCAYNPDEIYVSTPGPLGLLGLQLGKLLDLRVSGIYHSDFTREAREIVAEPALEQVIEAYCKWFFNQADRLLVPSSEYMELLKSRGFKSRHMQLFRRGLRTEHFRPQRDADRLHGANIPRLLYVGRISRDKNLGFLLECYRRLLSFHPHARLTLAGDGPDLAMLKLSCRDLPGVEFTGRIAYDELPALYNAHDLFLFPSVTDTFGMAVLEAQACGLPALVSDVGGPQEIVDSGRTGFALAVRDTSEWVTTLDRLLRDLREGGEEYAALSKAARRRIEQNYCWDRILQEMISPAPLDTPRRHRHKHAINRLLQLASGLMAG